MKKSKMFGLTNDEMNMILDSMNGKTHDLSCINWKKNLISDFETDCEINNLEEKWKVNLKGLIRKLKKMTELELLLLLVEVMYFWNDSGLSYKLFNKTPPHQKIIEILNQEKK